MVYMRMLPPTQHSVEATNGNSPDSPPDSRAEVMPAQQNALPGRIDVGWILMDNLDSLDIETIEEVRDCIESHLASVLPEFTWRLTLETHERLDTSFHRQPVEYLNWAMEQRDLRGWDYVLIFVPADLESIWKSHAWGAVSRSLDSAVISTARIDPRAQDIGASKQQREEAIGQRIFALVLRALGYLAGLEQDDAPSSPMGIIDSLADLDQVRAFSQTQITELRSSLQRVADLRLEEERSRRRLSRYGFYLLAGWRNRYEILSGIRNARPWQIPWRLGRLTLAALSTLLVLMMTAEAWDLAESQSSPAVAGLSLVAIVGTSIYTTLRQRLLVNSQQRKLSEQIVTTQLTAMGIVLLGITMTYGMLLGICWLVAMTLFPTSLIAAWTGLATEEIGPRLHLHFAAFAAAVGILIGALGASFEGQHFFRHVTLVDEEI